MKSKEEVTRRLRAHVAGVIALGSAKLVKVHSGQTQLTGVQTYGSVMLELADTADELISMIYDFAAQPDAKPTPPQKGQAK